MVADRWMGLLRISIACGLVGAALCLMSFLVGDDVMKWYVLIVAWAILGFSMGIDVSYWRTTR